MIKEVLDYWPLITASIFFIAGYTELKSRSKSNEAGIKELGDRINSQRKEDLERTENMLGEIRGDIKTLLQRRE
jgi:hypothetical protein